MRASVLFILLFFFGSLHAQIVYPFNPDSNADSLIGSADLIDVLSNFGSMFQAESITLDEQPLEALLSTLIAEINQLQGQVTALQAESLTVDSLIALTWGKQFAGIDLSHKSFIDANLAQANFFESNLAGANLTEANCFDANFNLSNLEGTNLTNADMYQAQFIGAHMSDAICTYVFFGSANLSGATVEGADFEDCSLQDAIMTCLVGCPINLPSPYACIPDETCSEPGRFKIEAQ